MKVWRVYTKPKGKDGKQKLAATEYRPGDAADAAGRLALKGQWVSIVETDDGRPEPSRWD